MMARTTRLQFTPREKIVQRGYCTGPVDGGPAPGEVGLDYKAPCRTCGRRVRVTVRGLYAHHKALAKQTPSTADGRLMLQARPYVVREQERVLIADCPFCDAAMPIPLGLRAGQGKKLCACGAELHGSGHASKLVELKLTAKERRALRLFRDHERHATTHVHGITRHALESKGLLRAGHLTARGRAALAPPDVPNIFDDLFPQKKET